MGARKNTRRQKADVLHNGHNRKPGVAARSKATRNKHNRRSGKAQAQNIIRYYVPNVFANDNHG
jgi:hypothetical protein